MDALTSEEVYQQAGRLVGDGVPWEAVWETPLRELAAFRAGLRESENHRRKDAASAARGLEG